MNFFRLGILAAAASLSGCLVTTAPTPPDFKLSAEKLSHKYRAQLKAGDIRLYAQKIDSTRDESGHESHLATGGALLVKDSEPPILAEAPSISITSEYSEARGKSTVKRNDRLYIGQDDATTIRIDGTEITLNGPVIIREVAAEDGSAKTSETEKSQAEAPTKEATKATQPVDQPEPAKAKLKAAAKPKAESTLPAKTTPPPAAKISSSPPAAKPKETPPVDRQRLLKLMREPTDR